MSEEKDNHGQESQPGQGTEQAQEQAQNPEQKASLSLSEMTPDMFQNQKLQKLLVWAKAIGMTGHNVSLADGLNAREILAKIYDCALGYRKFAPYVEQLLNGVLQGKIREEDVEVEEESLLQGLQYWLYFRVGMGFGKSDDSEAHENETVRALETILEEKILGDDIEKTVERLLGTCLAAESRTFVAKVGKSYLDATSRRRLVTDEQRARAEYEARFIGTDGKFTRTIAPPGRVKQERPEEEKSAEKIQEKSNIIRARVSVARWHEDEDYEDREQIKVTSNGHEVDPPVFPRKPLELVDEKDVADVTASIEIQGGKLMIVSTGKSPVFDLDSGIAVHMLEVNEGAPVRIQVDEDRFEISISDIQRESAQSAQPEATETPVAPEPAPSTAQSQPAAEEPKTHDDSQPAIEAKETEAYSLPAVMCIDEDEHVVGTYVCLDDSDRLVRIGTDAANDIVLPQGMNFAPFAAEIKFIGSKIFANAVKGSPAIRIKYHPPTDFIIDRPVHIDPDRIIVIGEKGRSVYFRPTTEHPFAAEDVKKSLTERLTKISALLDQAHDVQTVQDLELKINDFNKTLAHWEKELDVLDLIATSAGLSGRAIKAKEDLFEKERLENETKMAARRHYDADAGETAETPRPYKSAVLVDKIYHGRNGEKILHPVFPPGISMGKDKVNTLEAHEPQRVSKYGVQDFECTFVLDGSNVRMVIEPRTLKNTKVLINGQIPGTRDGKTHELDMLRAPLKDGDVIEVGMDRFGFETGHEFTLSAVRPYALAYLKEIMEIFILYPDRGDEGDKKNAQQTLAHFLSAGIITQAEIDAQRAALEKEKFCRETTGMACDTLSAIRGQNHNLSRYVEDDGELEGLPYDVSAFRAALELLEEPAVRWDETGWMPEEYRRELKRSATIRLHAYDKKLLDIRAKLQQGNYGTRLKAVFSREAEQNYDQEQESLRRAFRKMLVEMVSLIELGVMKDNYESHWLTTRLSQEQGQQAEEIVAVQRVMVKIHEGTLFTPQEVGEILAKAGGKTYGDFFNFREAPFEAPMPDFILAKVKARAKAWLEEAAEGDSISTNLGRIEELIAAGLVSYDALRSSPEKFQELRDMEEYFNKQKAGAAALAVLTSASEPCLEDILDFAKRLEKEEFVLSDEKDDEFKAYCGKALQTAVQKARVGEMTTYVSILAGAAVRRKLAKPRDAGTTMDELLQLPEKDETAAAVKEMAELAEEIRVSGMHNFHPLLKLRNHLGTHEPGTLVHEGKTGEQILQELVEQRLEKMFEQVLEGNDPAFVQMIVEDMMQYGLEPQIRECVKKEVGEAVGSLYEDKMTVDEVRPFIESLRLIGLEDMITAVITDIRDPYIGRSFENPDENAVKHFEKFAADLRALGLN